MRLETQGGQIGGEKGGPGERGRGQGCGAELPGRQLCAVRPRVPTGVPPRPVRGSEPQTCVCPRGAKAGVPETSPLGRPCRCPRGLPPPSPRRALPASRLQAPRPLTIIVVAHFLLAASLTVRHGLRPPPPGCGSSSGCSRPPRPGGQTRGLRGTAGAAALGARAARSGTAAGAGRTVGRRAGWAAAPTRDTRQG